MNILKNYCWLVLTVIVTNTYGQFKAPKQEAAAEFKKRSLMVQLRQPGDEILRDLKQDAVGLKRYNEWIEQSNEILKQSFNKFWKLNQSVTFASSGEIGSKLPEGSNQHALFVADFGTKNMNTPRGIRKRKGFLLSLYLAEQKKPVFEVMMPSDFLSENDYKFVFHTMAKYLEAAAEGKEVDWDVNANLTIVQNKPLLIAEGQSALTEDKAQQQYASTVKFTTLTDLENQIQEAQDILFCTTLFHMQKGIWMNATVDASTMDIVSLVPAESYEFSLGILIGERDGVIVPVFRSDMQLDKKYYKYTTSKLAMKVNH